MATVSSYTNSNTITYNKFTPSSSNLSAIYDDDYENFASFNYQSGNPLSWLKIGSPSLSSLGIPNNAIITNVKLTMNAYHHYNTVYTPSVNKMSININNIDYDTKPMNADHILNNPYVYDTGDISIIKSTIVDDMVYFLFEFQMENRGASIYVYALYWEITYEIGEITYKIRIGDKEVTKIYSGVNEVKNIYLGENKIYG